MKSLAIVSVASYGVLCATTGELRSPLNQFRTGTIHYPLVPIEKVEEDKDSLWYIDTWKAGYYRGADQAYISKDDCDSNKSTRNTEPLSQLFFGKADFRGEEAFAGGMLVTPPSGTPALSFAKLSPRFDYNEWGAVFGLHVQRRFEDSNWRTGGRVSVPVKVIEVEQSRSCGSERLEEGFADVIVRRQEAPGGGSNLVDANAYRLDFLSTLLFNDQPLVQYGDGTTANVTRIGGLDASEFVNTAGQAHVYALGASQGRITNLQDRLTENPTNVPRLNADGSGVPDNARRLFARANQNYRDALGQDREAQSKLFIVPSGNNSDSLDPIANTIQNTIEFVLNQIDLTERNSAEQFFKDHGVLFCQSDRQTGIGDVDVEWYVGYDKDNKWYIDYISGIRLPTGTKVSDPGLLLQQSTGNNRHVELKWALEGGWSPNDWFTFRAYASYSYVVRRTEQRAPAFKGATIKNVPAGLPVDTKVRWGYFLGNLDFTVFHPHTRNIGGTFGYELYAKQKNKVSFDCGNKARDFFGVERELDEEVLERNTNTLTHKIRGEAFYRIGYGEIFAGGSHVIAGRHAMKETEIHAGITIYF